MLKFRLISIEFINKMSLHVLKQYFLYMMKEKKIINKRSSVGQWVMTQWSRPLPDCPCDWANNVFYSYWIITLIIIANFNWFWRKLAYETILERLIEEMIFSKQAVLLENQLFRFLNRNTTQLTRKNRQVSSDFLRSHICCSARKTERHMFFFCICPNQFFGGGNRSRKFGY